MAMPKTLRGAIALLRRKGWDIPSAREARRILNAADAGHGRIDEGPPLTKTEYEALTIIAAEGE